MKFKYPIGDMFALGVIVIGAIFDLMHHARGKQIFYSGFILLALSHLYYRIYVPYAKNEKVGLRAFVTPVLLIAGAVIFFMANTRTALVLIFFGLALSFAQRTKLLTQSK